MNRQFLKLWILDKCKKMESKLSTSDYDDALICKGKLEILQELTEDFNLAPVEDEEIEFHNQF